MVGELAWMPVNDNIKVQGSTVPTYRQSDAAAGDINFGPNDNLLKLCGRLSCTALKNDVLQINR